MPDEKKPETGPVVIRKGHIKPPPDGAKIEVPVEEPITPAPQETADKRPLWKRLADEKAASGRPPDRSGPPGRRGPGGPGHGGGPRGDRSRGDRPPRRGGGRDRDAGSERSDRPQAARPQQPVEPPPMPELPVVDEGSFADMLADSENAPRRRFQVGEKVAGKILQIGQDVAFLELGTGLAEGMIEIAELLDAEGNVTARVGDIIDGVVTKGGDRGVVISKGHAKLSHDRDALIEAARTGLPVDGMVKAANKGGIEVEVLGQRAFCPMSQIDIRFVADPASLVGQKLRFKVQRADGRDAVLSRRALLEEEKAERARETRAKLAEGAVFDGTVTSVQDYGAFVDIGGLEGLLHVSELSWDRVSKPGDLLKSGDAVQVQVLRIDEDPKKGERISLSIKALQPRPEPEAPAATEPGKPDRSKMIVPPPPPKAGDVVAATVDRIEPYGIFVRFAGGRGLVPAAETGTPRGSDLRRTFKAGDALTCMVTEIDEQGRFRLSKTEAEAASERKEAQEYMAKSAPRGSGKGFGTLGDLLRDKLKNQ